MTEWSFGFMWHTIQRLSLGIGLILLASSILLISDAPRQKPATAIPTTASANEAQVKRVALFQMASQPILDEGAAGIIFSLKEAGYNDGHALKLTRFNAEGDLATANAIAQELIAGDYDLLITTTTGALQVVANANKQRKIPHVFGLVSDPIKAGVGIGADPMDHPAHLVGIGTLPPVDQAFALAKKLNPNLAHVGLAWNPAEVNSEVCTKIARQSCLDLKIDLMEANVESTAAVKEAIASLIDRRAEALVVGGDVTMLGAIDVVIKSATDAHLPVFTCMPGNAAKGALFDIGANYFEVGKTVGRVAARVLNGEPISKIPVEIAIPPKLFVNTLALNRIGGTWAFPLDVLNNADSLIDETGRHDRLAAVERPAPPKPRAEVNKPTSKTWELRLLAYVNSPDAEEAEQGFRDGLKKSGLAAGRDYVLKVANAQGDVGTLNGMVDAALGDRADMLLTISTMALQSSAKKAKGTPIVFTMVSNPFLAGVGKSDADHQPNVTGAYGANDAGKMMPIIRQIMPDAKRMGALYAPTEINSVYSHELLADAAKSGGFDLYSLGINTPSEAPDATQSLCDRGIDLFCIPASNLAASSYPTIAQAAGRAKIPVFGFLGSMIRQGAVAVLTRDYYDMGVESGLLAGRVILGEAPGSIPFHQCRESKLFVNPVAARACRLNLPESLLKSADKIVE